MHFFRQLLPACPRLLLWLALPLFSLLGACSRKYHQQRTMFQVTQGADGVVDTAKLRRVVNRTARNYRIQPNDLISVRVYTNKGEAIIDPNKYLQFSSDGGGTGTGITTPRPATSIRSTGNTTVSQANGTDYLVQADGRVLLPLVGMVKLQNLTLLQADSVLRLQYTPYYKESFVRTTVTNNRVVVLGASGGQVISLTNDNMNLLEVLALAGGVDGVSGSGGGGSLNNSSARYGGRVDNIRIIRGDLKNPQVQFVDLSTLEGMRRANLQIEPNDVIYIQPVRRPALEALTDATPFFSLFSFALGLVLLINNNR